MRSGCAVVLGVAFATVVLGGASLWVGSRLVQEPEVAAVVGSPEDGSRGQQKIFDLAVAGLAAFEALRRPSSCRRPSSTASSRGISSRSLRCRSWYAQSS